MTYLPLWIRSFLTLSDIKLSVLQRINMKEESDGTLKINSSTEGANITTAVHPSLIIFNISQRTKISLFSRYFFRCYGSFERTAQRPSHPSPQKPDRSGGHRRNIATCEWAKLQTPQKRSEVRLWSSIMQPGRQERCPSCGTEMTPKA